MHVDRVFKRLTAEVVRRRMLRTIAAYLVATVSTLTLADLVLPGLTTDESTYNYLALGFVAGLPIVIAMSWFFDITSSGIVKTLSIEELEARVGITTRDPAPTKVKFSTPAVPGQIHSVVILPFVNNSGDIEADYLSDGITETIINKLAKLANVRVVPRASAFRYKNTDMELSRICEELDVETSVTGSVSHVSDRLVVQAELVDPKNEAQLWGERYNSMWQDLFALQETLATSICESLKGELSHDEQKLLAHRETEQIDAYQEYMRGRFQWNKRTAEGLTLAITHFRAALEIDPQYALAYSGLADAYNIMGYYGVQSPDETFPLAKDADGQALELQPDLGQAYASLGYATLFYDRDWAMADEYFAHAIELNPRYGSAHQWRAWYYLVMERFDEALACFKRAKELDPLSQIINDHLAYGYMLTGEMDEARSQIELTRSLDPGYHLSLLRLGEWHMRKGDYERAAKAYAEVDEARNGRFTLGYLGLALGMQGDNKGAQHTLLRMDAYAAERYVSPLDRALVYAGLGDLDRTFEYLREARDHRVSDIVRLKLLPWPEPVKEDSRFTALANALHLPA